MCNFGDGFLGAERAALISVASELTKLGMTDPAVMDREQVADTVTALAGLSERLAVMAGQYMDVGERTAASLTKGEKSIVALVSSHTHVTRRRASQLLRAGTVRHRFPSFHQALIEGKITTGHIDLICRAAKTADTRQLAHAERALAALAVLCTPEEFAEKLAEWVAAADPNEHLDEFLRAQARRHLVWGKDLFGNIHLDGTMEPLAGEAVINAITARQKELEQLRPETRGSAAAHDAMVDLILGDTTPTANIEIIYPRDGAAEPDVEPCEIVEGSVTAQSETDRLLADHIADWLARLDRIPNGPVPVPNERDIGFGSIVYPRTAGGTLIPPSIVDQLAGHRRFHPIDPDGNLVNDRPGGRRFKTVQRRMIRLRDSHCKHPGCRTRHHHCDYDHIDPVSNGGSTMIANGQLLCRFHHRYKHRNDPLGSRIFDDSPIQLE